MIKYIKDTDFKYQEDILTHLRAHNITHSPKKPEYNKFFYVFDGKLLIGALHSSVSWDWVGIRKYFYKDLEVLELLLSSLCDYYQDSVSGIKAHSDDKTRFNDFLSLGFIMNGIMPGTKKVKEYYYADKTILDITSNSKYKIISSDTEIKEYTDTFVEEVKKYDLINGNLNDPMEISFVALDNDDFAGGILGELVEDTMYIDLLVVKEEYRGRGIAKKLMSLIEEEALKSNVVRLDLGTAEFQARDFYKKLGFSVVNERKDNPKGFKCYTMVKWLNI